ncbi:MAG: ABC transporter substrate-binding protein [Aggregatilineales bacterium]
MKRLLRFFLVVLVLSAVVPLSASAQSAPSTTVNSFFYEGEPNVLDPQAAQTIDEFEVLYNVYEGLVTYDPKTLEPVPLLADKWDISSDGLVYTFHLHPGVKFQNGRAMTADDVKYSLERLGNPATGTSYTSLVLNNVQGFADMRDKTKNATTLSGVKVIDPETVQITLTAPVGSFLKQLTLPGAFVVPKEAAESKDFASNPVGTGPYKVQNWTRQTSLTLEANPDYWRGVPVVKTVVIRTSPGASQQTLEYQAGNTDIAVVGEPDLARLRADATLSKALVNIPILSTFFLRVNLKDPTMSKVEVRQALALSIDRDAIVKTVLAGQGSGAQGLFPPGLSAFDPNFQPFTRDITKAKALLAQAGFPNGVTITVRTGQVESELRILNAVQQQVADAGITLTINSTEASIYTQDRNKCNMQLGSISFSQDYADADDFSPQLYREGGALGLCGYDSYPGADQIKAMLAQALSLPLGPDRDAAYRKIEQIAVGQQAVIIPIVHLTRTLLINPRLQGLVVDNNSYVLFVRIKLAS